MKKVENFELFFKCKSQKLQRYKKHLKISSAQDDRLSRSWYLGAQFR